MNYIVIDSICSYLPRTTLSSNIILLELLDNVDNKGYKNATTVEALDWWLKKLRKVELNYKNKINQETLLWYINYSLTNKIDEEVLSNKIGKLGSIKGLMIMVKARKNINYKNLLYFAASDGHFHLIKWIYSNIKLDLKLFENCVSPASIYNHVNILEWLTSTTKVEIDSTHVYINIACASANGLLDIIKWYTKYSKDRRMILENPNIHLTCASGGGHIHVLEWWIEYMKNNNLKITNIEDCMISASKGGHTNILDWLVSFANENGLNISNCHKVICQYSDIINSAMDEASRNNYINVLDWWASFSEKTGLKLEWSCNSMDKASKNGNIKILDWWVSFTRKTGTKLKWSSYAMGYASLTNNIEVLNWWNSLAKDTGILLKWNKTIICHIIRCRRKTAINWWKSSELYLQDESASSIIESFQTSNFNNEDYYRYNDPNYSDHFHKNDKYADEDDEYSDEEDYVEDDE